MPAVAWTVTPDGQCDFINRFYLEAIGLSEEYCLAPLSTWKKKPNDLPPFLRGLHPDHQERAAEIFWNGICSGSGWSFEAPFLHADNLYHWHFDRAVPLRDQNGKVVRFVGSCVDIEELRQAHEALHESEQSLRLITETIPEMLWTATPDGALDYCNKRVLDYTGGTIGDLQGAGWMKSVHPDDIVAMAEAWHSSVSSGNPFRFEFRGLRITDKMYRWCVSTALPLLDAQGQVVRWYGTVVDWHDWKETEEKLHNMQIELERAARVMTFGELAASIAHELNQPLAAIATNSETCLQWLRDENLNPAKARAAVTRALRDCRRASEVINRVRALLVKQVTPRSRINLNDVVRDVLVLTRSELRDRRVSIRTRLCADLPLVCADRVQLQQVILNLIINALESMASSQPKELEVESYTDETGDAFILVRDTGAGFSSELANYLFKPFFTTKEAGMGMGLAICKSIVESHGGRLWATSGVPVGAIFQFALPAESRCEP